MKHSADLNEHHVFLLYKRFETSTALIDQTIQRRGKINDAEIQYESCFSLACPFSSAYLKLSLKRKRNYRNDCMSFLDIFIVTLLSRSIVFRLE